MPCVAERGVTVTEVVWVSEPICADIVTLWLLVTLVEAAVKSALAAPLGTEIEAGTVKAGWLLVRVTAIDDEAVLFNRTLHADGEPPCTLLGLHVIDESVTGARIITVALLETPFHVAVTVTFWSDITALVTAVNVVLVAPAAIATDAGTVNAVLLSASATVMPPEGAAFVKLTVHVLLRPPATLDGLHAREESAGVVEAGRTVMIAVFVVPFKLAVTVAVWVAVTVPALALNVAEDAPAGTVTEAGTFSPGLLSVIDTLTPPDPAAPLKLTVQVADAGAINEDGLQLSPANVAGGGALLPIVPPVPDTVSAAPLADAPETPFTATDVPLNADGTVIATVASTPLEIVFEFAADTIQVYEPEPLTQNTVLPAAVAAGPAVAEIAAMAAAG